MNIRELNLIEFLHAYLIIFEHITDFKKLSIFEKLEKIKYTLSYKFITFAAFVLIKMF